MNIFGDSADFLFGGHPVGAEQTQALAQHLDAQRQRGVVNLFAAAAQQRARPFSNLHEVDQNKAMIGKVTPKPGYIIDWMHHDYTTRTVTGHVRAKTKYDYTLWERFLIWLAK